MKPFDLGAVLARSVRAHAIGRRAKSVVEAVHCAAGIYGSAPTSHHGLAVRVSGYKPPDLDDVVLRTRELVRVRAMRGSVYLVPRELVPHALTLLPMRTVERYAKLAGIEPRAYPKLAAGIEQIVHEKPRTAAEIREALGKKAPNSTGLSALLGRMNREGRIVRAAIRGGTRSQSYEYALMSDWIVLPDERPTVAEAVRLLAPLWLEANGPATAADLAWWAGASQRDAKSALAAIKARAVSVNGLTGELFATEATIEALASSKADSEIHLLPVWDAYVMAHRDRSRYLDDKHRPYVIDRVGNSTNVILRGGRVIGTWDIDGETLLYAPFVKLSRSALKKAAAELEPVEAIDRLEAVEPRALTNGPQNSFLSPLRVRR